MIHFTRSLLRRWAHTLLHIDDSPERTAAAFAVGVFCGFSPFLGLHTALAVALAFMFDLNRVAVLIGCYSNVPWIIGAYYAIMTGLGAVITRTKRPPDLREHFVQLFDKSLYHTPFWHDLVTIMRPLLWPYVVGSLIGAVVLAGAAYAVALGFVTSRRRVLDIIHKHPQ
jgi:uncharacterized protein (DUF2062 family)